MDDCQSLDSQTLLKRNFSSLVTDNNSLKYKTLLLIPLTLLTILALSLMNISLSLTKSLHCLNHVILTFVNFVVSVLILILEQLVPSLFTLNPTTATPSTSIFLTNYCIASHAITDFACTTAQAGRRVTNLTTDRLNEFPHQQHSFIDHLKLIANQCQLLSSHNSNVTFLAVQLLDLVSHVKFGVWKWVTIHSNAAVYRNHSMTTVSSMTLESLTTHIRQTDRQRDRQTDTNYTHQTQTDRQTDRDE